MKRTFGNWTLFLGLALFRIASAQESNGLEGIWYGNVTPIDCNTGFVLPNAPVFRGLYMFGHDGSLTNEAGFPVPDRRRSSGLGAWQHAQARTFTGSFRFFRYDVNGVLVALRKVTTTIVLNGDQFISMDMFQDFDADNHPIPGPASSGCNTVVAARQ